MADKGKLVGVSVGPGDPDLMTIAAVKAIEAADVIATPNIGHKRQTALGIAAEYVSNKELLDCSTPMVNNREERRAAYDDSARKICEVLDSGRNVAYLCLGDIAIYASYAPVHERVLAAGYEASIIPGVTSFSATAARLGQVLCEGKERLLIAPVMGGDMDEILDTKANKVLMKSRHEIVELRDKLEARGELEHASMVANCGLPDEKVFYDLSEITEDDSDYFSVVIVKEPKE